MSISDELYVVYKMLGASGIPDRIRSGKEDKIESGKEWDKTLESLKKISRQLESWSNELLATTTLPDIGTLRDAIEAFQDLQELSRSIEVHKILKNKEEGYWIILLSCLDNLKSKSFEKTVLINIFRYKQFRENHLSSDSDKDDTFLPVPIKEDELTFEELLSLQFGFGEKLYELAESLDLSEEYNKWSKGGSAENK